jgi:hypothetical protein
LTSEPSRLAVLVSNVGWVDAAIQSMGVDQVLADLRRAAAADLASPAVGAMLATVLGQAHHLRSPRPLAQPSYVLRQLWMQAAELGEDRLASDLRARLQSQPHSDLIPVWTTRRASHALSVELGRPSNWVTALAVLADGRVVSGGRDNRVLVWNATTQGQMDQLGCSVIGLVAVQASVGEASLVVIHAGQGFSLWSTARERQ